ncbi:MAG: exodeoxyribonuclease VII small subunit [Syntrophaceae bacterium]
MKKEKFEEAFSKLEEIVRKLESGNMSLEESLKAFEEGVRLSRICSERLDEAERRVEILVDGEKGIIKPFEDKLNNDR